jgi:hypothetical protein
MTAILGQSGANGGLRRTSLGRLMVRRATRGLMTKLSSAWFGVCHLAIRGAELRDNIRDERLPIKSTSGFALQITNRIQSVLNEQTLSLHLVAITKLFEIDDRAVVGRALLALPKPTLFSARKKFRAKDHRDDRNLGDSVPVLSMSASGVQACFDALSHGTICLVNAVIEFTEVDPIIRTTGIDGKFGWDQGEQ